MGASLCSHAKHRRRPAGPRVWQELVTHVGSRIGLGLVGARREERFTIDLTLVPNAASHATAPI